MFKSYIQQYTKNTDEIQTHLSFKGGKYNIDDGHFFEFYKKYYDCIKTDEKITLIEKINGCVFNYFIDIDSSIENNEYEIESVINVLKEIIFSIYENEYDIIVSKSPENKYHINVHKLVVNTEIAISITNILVKHEKLSTNKNMKYIDKSVYKTGLRMLGSYKSDLESKYDIYDLKERKNIEITEELFFKTIIRTLSDLTKIKNNNIINFDKKEETKKTNKMKNIPNEEIQKLLMEMKSKECYEKYKYNFNINKIVIKKNKFGACCYYISINDMYCPFKKREHERSGSPLYIELLNEKFGLKCFDSECQNNVYPENYILIDIQNYPKLNLSLTTRYWDTDLQISKELRNMIESSLTGGHYKVAKCVFSIYENIFRVGSTKDDFLYEFDGFKWKKSYILNTLLSETLPLYYNSVKLRDTSDVFTENIKEYISENDKNEDEITRNEQVNNIVNKLQMVNFKSSIKTEVINLYKHKEPDFLNKLNTKINIINFTNGVYDFKTKTFRKALYDDYSTFSTNYDYMEINDDEIIQHKIISEIFDFLSKIIPNKNMLDYLLKILGKSLIGKPDEEFFIFTGANGANGKSTLINLLEKTFGDYSTGIDVSLITNKRTASSSATPDIVRLKGKRLLTFQEPESNDKLRTGLLKQFTGGDTIIARGLYEDPVTFKLQATMIMCCNDLPDLMSIDGGTMRRIKVVEFTSRFIDNPNPKKKNEYKRDKNLQEKMNIWYPYFMNILITYYYKGVNEGIVEPEEVNKATDKYKMDNDIFNRFFNECVEECDDNENYETLQNIYTFFASWWQNNFQHLKIPDEKKLKKSMRQKYGTPGELIKNKSLNYIYYIRLVENLEEDDEFIIE